MVSCPLETGNSLKWSKQDYLVTKKPRGLIRKELLRSSSCDREGIADEIDCNVEYSINRKQRWVLAEALLHEAERLEEMNERIYGSYHWYAKGWNPLSMYRKSKKTGEYVTRVRFMVGIC